MAYRTLDPTKKTEREIIDSKIRAVVNKLGNTLPIEGIEVWNEKQLSFRSEAK